MPDVDFFNFFQKLLALIAGVYATVITAQSLWTWYVWLAGNDRYITLLRRYVLVQGLRLRVKAFWGDVIICILLCVAFVMVLHANRMLYDAESTLENITHAVRHA